MSSFRFGKDEVRDYLVDRFPNGSTALDVGACDGIWWKLLGQHFVMDAIEIFEPNIESYKLREKYREVFNANAIGFEFEHYDLIIFGDVLEHMTVEDAQKCLEYAKPRCQEIIIAVPYRFKQGPFNGNVYEKHIQDDLTHELFMERYPGFERFVDFGNYGYYRRTSE